MYFSYAADRYRNRVLSILRQKYAMADLFSLMVNIDDPIEGMSSFARNARRKQEDFLSNMDFIRGFKWLDAFFERDQISLILFIDRKYHPANLVS